MNKDEIVLDLRRQLADSNRRVNALLQEVAELKDLLVRKTEEEQKQRNIARGLLKIMQNRSEKQTPVKTAPAADTPDDDSGQAAPAARPREKTNYGAKRIDHYVTEVEHVAVDPDDPRFDRERARWISERESARYILIPMRFIKRIYHVNKYVQDGTVMEGKAPDAPFLGSNYDGSFIAGIAQLRYLYSMPVERIVNFFTENGFEIKKGTAHGLLRKTELLFENLYKALGLAVKEDDYVAGDKTYHKVLVAEKNKDGKGIRKGYIWDVTAVHLGLTYYFYNDGSRSEKVILNYIGDYGGTFQSDGFSPYRKMARKLTRLACLQHVKRKFLDCGDDFDARVVVRLINHLYHKDHIHEIGKDGWTVEDNTRWR